ncbi:MAG: hypothetical protein M5U09_27095 [Gammaproteobacteria bacterium]|nr:hypothetical protein [Gammaproteobacteria bacterium]
MIELHLLRTDSGEDIAGGYFLKDPESGATSTINRGSRRTSASTLPPTS